MPLSPKFGLTYGFTIDRKVKILLSSDTPVGIAKSMGLGMMGFADALAELQPDMVLMLGDQFKLVARIPIAHLHGAKNSSLICYQSYL
jgi:GDP/UDP-N,N'-diacetylbacillosamine 2-epimerase (hydrolysing)